MGELRVRLVGWGDEGKLGILVPAGLGQSVFWCGGDGYGVFLEVVHEMMQKQ